MALERGEPLLERAHAAAEQLGRLRVQRGERSGRARELALRRLEVERLRGRGRRVLLPACLRQADDEDAGQDENAHDPWQRALHDPYGSPGDGFLRAVCFN